MGLTEALKETGPGVLLRRFVGDVRTSLAELVSGMEDVKLLAAEPSLARIRDTRRITSLQDVELRVFSQFGDDGIIHFLTHHLPISVDTFVEFGVADYREANTRLLLLRENWRGLVMDSSDKNVASIKRSPLSWRHELIAKEAFVDRENVNGLLADAGIRGRIGLLHIDIDGNDYWVWERLDGVDPDIVIVEYNSVLGMSRPVVIPYDPAFRRDVAHPSWLYWGASLPALAFLARRKGYAYVGTNRAGNNAYFVRAEMAAGLPQPKVEEGRVSRFRESRGPGGELTFLQGDARRRAIADLSVIDVSTGERVRVGDLP